MSGETEKQVSGWTTDTLKERFDNLREADQIALQAALVAQEKAVAAALTAAKEAVNKAEMAAEKRFESVNEFRGQLADQTATLMPRTEYDTAHQAVIEKIDSLTDRMNRNEGKTMGSEITMGKIYAAIAAVGVVVGIVVILVNGVIK